MNQELFKLLNRKKKHILINLKNPSPAHKPLIERFIKKEKNKNEERSKRNGKGRNLGRT